MMAQAPVSFVAVRRRFDFRSIEVGRWVTSTERDRAAGRFYEALNDLMMILQGPEPLISLRGTLAKNAGAGSLAHEWFHAFDHYMGSKAFHSPGKHCFSSKAWLDSAKQKEHPLNEQLGRCFQAILLSEDSSMPSDFFRCSQQADQRLKLQYYAKPEELCARAFEAFVEDNKSTNNFLVHGTVYSDEAKEGLYPQSKQRQSINDAFQDYFAALGAALHREQAKAG